MLIYCSTRSKQFLLLYKATFVTGRLLLRLNLEREVTAGLLLRVLLPPPQMLLMVLEHVTCWVTWRDVTSFYAFSRTWLSYVCHAITGTSLTLALLTFVLFCFVLFFVTRASTAPKVRAGGVSVKWEIGTCYLVLIRCVTLSNQPWSFGLLFALFH